MTKKLLIDAKQPEETRVVLLNGNRIEDFDQETTTKIQNKGNVYLARVTRVEPSLQAAFVEYGGNRHGFLAFSEIHPDYYRIPVEDRKAITEEMVIDDTDEAEEVRLKVSKLDNSIDQSDEGLNTDKPEVIGGEDQTSHAPTKIQKRYKIQEVISKRQILLVQVSKEERGNKGAALTTYISLAGRYCVLMPNTIRGGGVSRKINKIEDRKRLKSIIDDMKMPDGMAVIIRTAGSDRNKLELKRDFNYLQNLWNIIRERTLQSTAPKLINEEGNLIKRTIRDLYTNEVTELLVAGNNAYEATKEYIKLMVPNHIKRVKIYDDVKLSLFQKYQVEKQLEAMHLPNVNLKSGGYLVINQTEALVAIDVNSGRATKERNIEETALKTNLEAAEEVARQLKLRDLSGLIVIDFIDMEGYRNQNSVEKKLKESMSTDRARIQIGRISHFGLLELSRQRLRPSVSENYFSSCSNCGGTGVIRSVESSSLRVLRKIEESNIKNEIINVFVPTKIGIYILNHKRKSLTEMEKKASINILIDFDDNNSETDCRIEKTGAIIKNNKSTLQEINVNNQEETDDEEQKKKRRRGKRAGKGRNRTEPVNELTNIKSSELKKPVNDEKIQTKEELEIINKSENFKKESKPKNLKIKAEKKPTINNTSRSKESHKSQFQNQEKSPEKKTSEISSNKKILPVNQTDKNKVAKSPKKLPKPKNEIVTPIKNTLAKVTLSPETLAKKEKVGSRSSKSSQPLKVLDVDKTPKKKRGGWWSQNKK